jgi:hypothetical protein
VVLAAYLRGETDLTKGLIDTSIEDNPLAQLQMALFGYQGVFAPAVSEAVKRMLTPPYFGVGVDFFADRFLPAQIYKPVRTKETIQALADTLNGSPVGVVFNAYDPVSGNGFLYGNDVARDRMDKTRKIPLAYDQQSSDLRLTINGDNEDEIFPITAEAVESALWLSLYGFAAMPGNRMDGAYHRSCILSELHNFEEVIVCRPLANGWGQGNKLPQSYFDVQDWNTEMWFSVGYKAEVDAMKRINVLVKRGAFKAGSGMKLVDLQEVEPTTPAGYFNYFIERDSVFEDARLKADSLFKWLKGGKVGPRPKV